MWITCLVGFGMFRLFDITKPPPVRQLERLPQGWGVLVDDLAAGVYANIAAHLILRLWLVS
jgi:phosphatidylglycerophosphatase A